MRLQEEVLQEPDAALWRFMSILKFVAMLDSRSLYFCRVDRFDDHREAAISKPVLERGVAKTLARLDRENPGQYTPAQAMKIALSVEAASEIFIREGVFANCWHRNERESGAMWSQYGGAGIAIRTTLRRLFEATRNDEHRVHIQPVTYVDHDIAEIEPAESFLYKHDIFSDEREYRAFILQAPKTQAFEDLDPNHPLAFNIACPLEVLIESVHLAPGSGAMQEQVVSSLLDRYGLSEVPVRPSIADAISEYRVWFENKRRERRRAP